MLVRVPLAAMRDFQFPNNEAGYLETSQLDSYLQDAAILWISDYTRIYENNQPLNAPTIIQTRLSPPSNRAFTSFNKALAHINKPSNITYLNQDQALLDIHFDYLIESENSDFSIEPALGHLGLKTVLAMHYIAADGVEHSFNLIATQNTGSDHIALDPDRLNVASHFIKSGFLHILTGVDHLLFLLCLVIPVRRIISLIVIATAFTLAHSITLIASALGFLPQASWFPALVETLIATSILYMALENIVGRTFTKRWRLALAFGLIHGFGFSYALSETLQFSGSHLVTALLAFNIGVELGQLVFLLLTLPFIHLLLGMVKKSAEEKYHLQEQIIITIASALLAHTAWHWMLERYSVLVQYHYAIPDLDSSLVASSLRWLILGLVVITAGWLFGKVKERLSSDTSE